MPTIAHISDLHLQSGNAARQAQVEPILQKINEMKPDLVVISGDLTDDGWDSIDELKWSKAWLDERIEAEWLTLPGNHDIGNFATMPEGVVTSQRVKAWCDVFKDRHIDVFDHIIEDWEILGLNSMVAGSGLYAEIRQWERFVGTQQKGGQQPAPYLAVFMHAPLFVDSPTENDSVDVAYWLGPIAPVRKQIGLSRSTLITDLIGPRLRLLASGHVHQTRLTEVDGVKIAWAPPASGTWVHAPGLPNPPMPEQTGFFLHTLHDDGRVESELIECAPMLKLYEHKP